jgi:hypothetical protein
MVRCKDDLIPPSKKITESKKKVYRAWNEEGQRVTPHAPKTNKTWLGPKILKQEVEPKRHKNSIAIYDTCSPIHITNIKIPCFGWVTLFLHHISCCVTKRGNHEYQCS